ncbi:MAG: FAD-dependent oxidoreductase [Pseudomonadota bacterium]
MAPCHRKRYANMTALAADVAVVGAGITGAAVAYGLARRGLRVSVLDARDPLSDLAPAVAPLMVQDARLAGPGDAQLAQLAVQSWVDFDAELADIAGCHAQYRRDGGLHFCSTEADCDARLAALRESNRLAPGAVSEFEMLDAAALRRLVPRLNGALAGASYCRDDARVNPQALRRALGLALLRLKVDYRPHCRVQWVREQGGEWVVMARGLAVGCGRVAIACGVDGIGLVPPSRVVSPGLVSRAHSVVQTQPLAPFLPFAATQFNQAGDGSLLLDTTALGVGPDADASAVRKRASALCPGIGRVGVLRSWHRDRAATPAGSPCYAPLDAAAHCWLLASPEPVLHLPVHSGLVADAVAGRIPAAGLRAFYGVPAAGQSGAASPGIDRAG